MRRAGRRAVPGRHGTCACLLSIGRATPTLVKSVYDVQTGQACSKMRLGFVCVFFSGLAPGCPCAPAIQSWIRANKLPLLGRTRTRTAEQSTHGARAGLAHAPKAGESTADDSTDPPRTIKFTTGTLPLLFLCNSRKALCSHDPGGQNTFRWPRAYRFEAFKPLGR